MDRKATTKFLSDLLIDDRLTGTLGKYWAREVVLDYGTNNVKRVDFMQFCPENQVTISGLEKGIFICYEVKSCKADFNSGYGQNFIGEKNYYVMPISLYKELEKEIPRGIGVMCPIPIGFDKHAELANPTKLDVYSFQWELVIVKNAIQVNREKSITELLFCMLRSKH